MSNETAYGMCATLITSICSTFTRTTVRGPMYSGAPKASSRRDGLCCPLEDKRGALVYEPRPKRWRLFVSRLSTVEIYNWKGTP